MTVTILRGDCRDLLKTLPDESVHCVVTSPPYWGLRDYGTAQWDGGDPECDHRRIIPQGTNSSSTLRADGVPHHHLGNKEVSGLPYSKECGKCGATRIDSQIGLEPTPEAYVSTMVEVFREVRRVLRKDGTLWLNLGDSYASSGLYGKQSNTSNLSRHGENGFNPKMKDQIFGRAPTPPGLKPKDLVGIPWRVAFALQADSWYLRQDIIWAKPNPMPESVTDRCTKAHEYIFLLSKSGRYYYDAEAIAEDGAPSSQARAGIVRKVSPKDGIRADCELNGQSRLSVGTEIGEYGGQRNKRSVWTIAAQPFSEAHFATFPPALIEPCVMAGCPKGGTVLDPFGGAGTTGMVADRLGRDAILIELNPEYATMAEQRLRGDAGMFAEVTNGLEQQLSTAHTQLEMALSQGADCAITRPPV